MYVICIKTLKTSILITWRYHSIKLRLHIVGNLTKVFQKSLLGNNNAHRMNRYIDACSIYITHQVALFFHLISLWFPSICQRARGPGTQYLRRRMESLHLWCTPVGSVLRSDCLTLSHWTLTALLLRYPISILMPIPGCFLWASLVTLSKSSSQMSLYASYY